MSSTIAPLGVAKAYACRFRDTVHLRGIERPTAATLMTFQYALRAAARTRGVAAGRSA
jgi:hypothetical protein